MPRKSEKPQKEIREGGKFGVLAKFVSKAKAFLGQRHVWLSLTVGSLWMLSGPFVITIFQLFWSDFLEMSTWIFQAAYFPLTVSSLIFPDLTIPGIWILVYGFSFMISMFFCLGVSHIIHRVHVKNVQN